MAVNVKLAVVEHDMITNVIVGRADQVAELSAALGKEVVYVPNINVAIGDMRVGGNWTRNVGGVQTILDENPTYDELAAELTAMETAMAEGVDSINE